MGARRCDRPLRPGSWGAGQPAGEAGHRGECLLVGLEGQPASQKMVERYGQERWGKEKLAARFRQGIEWGARHQVPLYCGEFGVYPPRSQAEHRANWFRDFGEVLAANRIGWAVWGWDEGFGLNRRLVNNQPVVDGVVARALGLKVVDG